MKRQRFHQKSFLLLWILLLSFLAWSWAQAGPKALVDLNMNSHYDVGVLDVETKTIKNLTNTPNMRELSCAWSPDGQKILFLSLIPKPGENYKLEVMNADGTARRVLDFIKDKVWSADWAPSGKRLALSLERDDNEDIYTVRLDGSDLQRLTDLPADDFEPLWSPNGRRIAFLSKRENDRLLYVMSASGGNLIQLTEDFDVWEASWSPDGTKFVLRGTSQGNLGYFILDADGKGKLNPLILPWLNGKGKPVWLPDGRILLHTFDGIFTVDVKEEQGVVKGENLTPLFKGRGPGNELPFVRSWFDPAFAPKQSVHQKKKLPVILGRLKAAMFVK